ncbi:MAG: type II secretion system secretin GspD [Deltaproteobacteria bacterium]|nr:type II secretion system secretin GspD [Deltaproteobacteria bacterium]
MPRAVLPTRSMPMAALTLLAAMMLGVLPATAQQRVGASTDERRFVEGDELVHLDFKDVELAVVIETIARITGKNFIYDDRVRGRVTIVSPSEVTADQAFAVFESVLKIKGFTAVPGPGGVLKIVPVRDAKESSIRTIRDGRPSPNRDTFVTRLVPLLYIDANEITNTIKPLVSKDASMVAYAPTNTIILTDTEANIRRLLSILEAIDIESYKEELAVIKIRYADAIVLAEQVSEIYGGSAVTSATSSTSAAQRSRRSSSSRRRTTTPTTSPSVKDAVRIMTDARTNSLLVLASRGAVEDIRELVRQLDVPLVGGGRIHVYYLRHADAEELSQTLQGLLGGARAAPTPGRSGAAGGQPQSLRSTVTALAEGITINPDIATNSLVIQASKESYEALVNVIEQLDIPRPQVLVEALILEVDVTDQIDLGVEWTINVVNGDQEFFFTTAAAASGGAPQIAGVIQRAVERDGDGDPVAGAEGTDVNAVLKAAAQEANLNIVSSPHILTSDNEEAEIRIGNNIPIITGRTNSATGNTAGLAQSVNVERQDIGVTLRVTPQISEGDSLRLKIFEELTDINTELQEDVGNPEDVGVSLFNRKVENTVVVKDGETVVIGGLISDRWIYGERKVPFLGDIPGLGWAFKSTSKDLRKINLLIFLTPHIIRNPDELEYQSIRKRSEFEAYSGKDYQTDQETLDRLDKEDGKWAPSQSPALGALRKHADRYSVARRQELEELQRETEAQRVSERLEADAPSFLYGVRVDLYRDESRAAEDLTKLLDAGYEGTLISGDSDGSLLFELVVGPYDNIDDATDAAAVLEVIYGYSPSVTVIESVPDGSGIDEIDEEDEP